MSRDEAERMALTLDSVEADLVMLQHRVYRVRQALERVVGHPVGFQYGGDREERPVLKDERKPWV